MTDVPASTMDTADALAQPGVSRVSDYVALLKPRVMSLVVFTGLVGLWLAPGHIHPFLAAVAVAAIAIGAGASGAINMWYDRDIDTLMARTRGRPIPAGVVAPDDALGFGVLLSIFSVALMSVATNTVAAALLAFTIGFYVFVYTIWLKRRTPQNIVIGGAAGAFPPLIGWAAVTGELAALPILLFLIIFLWTPPHFWALALYRMRDYGKVGVPMLPVVAGRATTLDHILGYALVLVMVTLVPVATGDLGIVYLVSALALGGTFVGYAWRLRRTGSDVLAMRTFRFSIVYLFALFAAMAADKGLEGLIA